ncbi:hypothetical protein [Actinoplanes siamensis]|uniref:Clp R domain-containing protein n=1 Tax=Actinoplanes siamensis TaxID=1223317 RepID=A0A919N1X4_9ACTN|nr:hypothetical protein [Actinoplanes siamensis]GIF02591.1 hypothetical protein Asi03nite_01290 [Actinoplanes siamensis]
MQVTDQARYALVLAAEKAHESGERPVDARHLLLALAETDGGARHALTRSAPDGREPGNQASPPDTGRPGPGAKTSPPESGGPFPPAPEIAARALARARTAGRDYATTTDFLVTVLDADDGRLAAMLHAAGLDSAPAGRDHADCCAENGYSPMRPLLAAMGARAGGLPGRARTRLHLLTGLLPLLLLYALVLAVTWDTAGPETILAVGVAVLAAGFPLILLAERRQLRALLAAAPDPVAVPTGIRPLLDRLGLRDLEVRRVPGAGADRCLRRGRRAWLLITSDTEEHPDRAGFVLWHEVAHLVRRDVESSRPRRAGYLGLYAATLISLDPRALAVLVVGGLLLGVGRRWWAELACDRLAVRFAGVDALRAWAAGRAPARARHLLTHPPLGLRAAVAR